MSLIAYFYRSDFHQILGFDEVEIVHELLQSRTDKDAFDLFHVHHFSELPLHRFLHLIIGLADSLRHASLAPRQDVMFILSLPGVRQN